MENWQHSRIALSLWLSQREFAAALHTDAPRYTQKTKGTHKPERKEIKSRQVQWHTNSVSLAVSLGASGCCVNSCKPHVCLLLIMSTRVKVVKELLPFNLKTQWRAFPLMQCAIFVNHNAAHHMKWWIRHTPHNMWVAVSLKLVYERLFSEVIMWCASDKFSISQVQWSLGHLS